MHPYHLKSTVQQCSHLKLLGRVNRSASFLACSVRAQPCPSTMICGSVVHEQSNKMHSLSSAVPLLYVLSHITYLWCSIWVSEHFYTSLLQNFLVFCRIFVSLMYLYGIILMTLWLVVQDWWVLRTEQCFIVGLI